jgi:lipopolysaccharide export system permease protein
VSLAKVTRPLFVLVLTLSLCTLLLSDKIASASHYNYRLLLAKIGLENPAAALEEGTFIKRFKNFVIFIYEIDKNKLKGIRIYQPQEGRSARTITAQKGELISVPERGIIKLKLIHGTSDEPDPKDPSKLYKLNFKTYDLPLNVADIKESDKTPGKKPKDMTIRELETEIERLGEAGIKATYSLSTEIHNKIAMALSPLTFLLIGIPLGITTRRGDRSMSFGLGLVVMTAYWTMLIGGRALAQKGMAPPLLCMEFSNVVIGMIGLFLFRRLAKN